MNRLVEEMIGEELRKREQALISEARQEEAASLTIRQLIRKLGGLDEATQERVRQLSLEGLERLGEDLLDFPNKAALTEWLDRMQESPPHDQ